MRLPSHIRRGFRAERSSPGTYPASSAQRTTVATTISRYIPLLIHKHQPPKSGAEGLIKPKGRIYRQEYVVFLRAVGGKIVFMREYFDPTRAAKALDTPILDLEPW